MGDDGIRYMEINNKKIGPGHPCFITFEIGATHNGVESAKNLIKIASESGADAVKFQIFDSEKLISNKQQMFSYDILVNRETNVVRNIEESLYEILKRRELSRDQWASLKHYADSLGLAFFVTIGFEDEIEFAAELGCQTIKIASADINHFPLIRAAAKTGLSIQLDTGMSTLDEVSRACDIIESEGNSNIIIHHCSFGYPAKVENINLGIITKLKEMFSYPIAYSDHSIGMQIDIAALAMGVDIIEKTITEDKSTPSVEHIMSLEPHQLKPFVNSIRDVELAMAQNELTKKDKEKRDLIRRSIFLKNELPAGHQICEQDLTYRRPGHGIQPDQLHFVLGKKLKLDKSPKDMLELEDLID